MKKVLYLAANAMAAFMDFGVGCLIATLTALLAGHPLSWWEPVVAGAVFSLLPDYDIAWPILAQSVTGRELRHKHHESLMHWPMLILPLTFVFTFGLYGEYWGITASMCVVVHYIHDGVMMGQDGPAWFLRRQPDFWTRLGKEEPVDHDHTHWIRINWMRPSKLSATEVCIGSVAIGSAVGLMTGSFLYGFIAYAVFVVGAMTFWEFCRTLKFV